MNVLLITLNAKYIHSSLALRSLREYCRLRGIEVNINEYTINQSLSQILSDIYRRQPQVVGIACYIWNIRQVTELCGLLRKVMPAVKIILGGPEVSYDPAEILSRLPIDYIIQGEGEQSLAELLLCLQAGTIHPIPGVACRDWGASACQVVSQLDEIPFAYQHDLEELQDKIIYYETSRGCPFSCQYCLSSATMGVRFNSLQRVIADLQRFIDADVKQVKFVDRTFNTKKEHYLPILRFLAGQKCRTNFHFEIAADHLDQEAIAVLTSAPPGRFQLEIGVQSVYEPTLRAIKRKNDWEKIARHVAELRATGTIHLHLDLIVGLPFETMEIFAQSFNTVYTLQPHMLQIGFLKMLKGSGIRNAAAKHGYVFTDEAPYEVLANNYMDYGDIRKLHIIEEVFNLTYNSGRFLAAMRFIIQALYHSNAFNFYRSLADYWEEREMDMAHHSPKTMYEFFCGFCKEKWPLHYDVIVEFLKFDALTSDNGSIRPDFLPWSDTIKKGDDSRFWRNEAVVRRYLPDFRFTSWRDVNRHYQIELFAVDIPHYLTTGELVKQDTLLLFDYRQAEPVYLRLSGEEGM